MAPVSWQLTVLAALLTIGTASTPGKKRSKRQAYELPAGSELLLYAPLSTSFRCQGEGYYADVQNNCQVYHVCHQVTRPDGAADFQHYSFMCGNQTVFDQLSLTCAFPEDAVPCNSAPDFYYVNAYIGVENAPFLTEDDVRRADAYKQGRRR